MESEQHPRRVDVREGIGGLPVSERRQQEELGEALEAERDRLAAVLDNLPLMLAGFDENRVTVFWNRECERVTGYLAEEMVGNADVPSLLYPDKDYREAVLADWATRIGDWSGQRSRITCKDGAEKTIEWSSRAGAVPVPGWTEWTIGVDVTESERVARLFEAQRDLAIALGDVTTATEALALCLRAALDATGCGVGVSYQLCEDGVARLIAQRGLPAERVDALREFTPDAPEAGLATAGSAAYRRIEEMAVAPERTLAGCGVHAVGVVPIRHHDTHVGTVVVATEQDQVPDWARVALETIASQVGNAVAGIEARDAARQSNARYQAIFDTSFDGIVLTDMAGHIIDANQVFVEMLGHDLDLLRGLTSADLTAPGWIEAEAEIVSTQILKRGYSDPYEKQYVRKDGSVLPVLLRRWLVSDADGRPIGMAAWVRDITEEKRTQAELETLARFPSENPNVVMRVSADGTVMYANGSCGPLLEAWGCEVGDRVPEQWRKRVAEVLRAGHVAESECDCPEIVYSLMLAPVRDCGYVNIYGADITSRVEGERERSRLETQIQAAQKLESLGVLAGGIAHDFNNILVGILGNADLAMMDLAPESPVRRRLAGIIEASERAADLTNQMLAYSGKGRFVVEHVDITNLVQEMTHLLEVSASKKAVIKYDLAPGQLPPVEADVTQIRQVLVNLVTNASEALGAGVGIITIRTRSMYCDRDYLRSTYIDEELPEGQYVVLEISDTGCGMDSETLEQIFDPFFTTKFTGRGLGLAAVLGIIRGHKGAVKVYSEPGHGTSFRILLPAVEAATKQTPGAAGQSQVVAGTVLLVDDEEIVRDLASDMLRRLGLEVIVAADGVEALELYAERGDALSLVVLDMTMPRMNGEEAFRRMKRLRTDIPILVTSGYNEQEAIERFAGQGLAGFIQKPYQFNAFGDAVRKALEV